MLRIITILLGAKKTVSHNETKKTKYTKANIGYAVTSFSFFENQKNKHTLRSLYPSFALCETITIYGIQI